MNQELGISYKEAKMYDESLKTYNAVIKLDPENKAALYNISVVDPLYTLPFLICMIVVLFFKRTNVARQWTKNI